MFLYSPSFLPPYILLSLKMSFDSSRSANSGDKSKRSFNSIASNSSNNTNSNSNNSTKKKMKTTNQKTLGVAWGSNSKSSSRSSFRSSPFSDFGSYMEVKNRKLQKQFDAEATSSKIGESEHGKLIFHDVSIFVDGFTVPSSQELRGYMLKHGGRLENYFSRHRVTHIICSNLPDSKIKNLRSFSGGLPVVKPTWVLDSVAANKLLSWLPYQLDQLAIKNHNQPKLSAFFTSKTCTNADDDDGNHDVFHAIPEIEDSTMRCSTPKKAVLYEVEELVEDQRQTSGESDNPLHANCSEGSIEEPSYCCDNSRELKMDGACEVDTVNQCSVKNESFPFSSTIATSHCLNDTDIKVSTSSTLNHSNQRHSTAEDPNFVENYFKSSRLHFIGTWRNRYRKRFMRSKETNSTNSDFNASASAHKTSTIHLDMDCFFVSVITRNHPELRDKPVAVCSSDNSRGTAEISSANYLARDYGIRAGIFVRDAKALCPQLVIVPYNFGAYEEVADQFYNILHQHCNKVQAVSCDEAFLEVADSDENDLELVASLLRKEIFETTGCTASAGIAGNMLMARLATRIAKPDGQCYISPEKVDDYLLELPIKQLPGIGRVLEEKLKMQEVRTCGQLRMISKENLQKDFGIKTGDMLWNYSRGVDNRLVGLIQESKSIGAEVNWGVRFKDLKDSRHFLINLCKEVSLRLLGCGVRGRTFTLKIKKRKKDAEEPTKYMGCGDCENLSHSMTVPEAVDDLEVLQRISKQLFGAFHIDVQEIRGVGLQVSRLENVDATKQGTERNSLKLWLTSASARPEEPHIIKCATKKSAEVDQLCGESVQPSYQMGNNISDGEAREIQAPEMPPLSQLDMGVIESLPPDIFSEMNEMYGGKLVDFLAETKCCERVEDSEDEGEGHVLSQLHPINKILAENKVVSASGEGTSKTGFYTSHLEQADLLPSSLSQVDPLVLQHLPEKLRVGLLKVLPPHRITNLAENVASHPHCEEEAPGVSLGLAEFDSNKSLWIGDPQPWIDKFRISNCSILKVFAEMYFRVGVSGKLSTVLQKSISEVSQSLDPSCDGCHEAIQGFSDLLKQYIKLKIETDIEEIYDCFCLLKRLRTKLMIFLEVYDIVYPYLQASVGEIYGGSLHI